MSHGHHPEVKIADLDRRFEFDGPARKWVYSFIGTGLILFILGLILAIAGEGKHLEGDAHGHGEHHSSITTQHVPA